MHAWSCFCFNVSISFLFLYIALCSFDIFPWINIPWFPSALSYYFGIFGCLFLFLSGRWWRCLVHMKAFVGCVAIFVAWLVFSSWLGGGGYPPNVFRFSLVSVMKYWFVHACFLIWSAMCFSLMAEQKARRFFFLAVMTLTAMNAVHILCELFAIIGFDSVKEFLVSINKFIRLEKIGHGWWPPAFYGRPRGLFAEPSHMAFALLPALGLFLYKMRANRLWLLAVFAWLCVMLIGMTLSGIFSFVIVVTLFMLPQISAYFGRLHIRYIFISVLGILLICTIVVQKFYSAVDPYLSTAASISAYVKDVNSGKSPKWVPLKTNLGDSSLNTRLVTSLLDIDMGMAHPLGVGGFLRGFWWAPLDNCDISNGGEVRLYAMQARNDPMRGIPILNQYTAIFAEHGWPGLIIFCALLFFLVSRIGCQAVNNNDAYLWSMTCVFLGMLASFMIISIVHSHMFGVFAGYLFAISKQRCACKGGVQVISHV